MYGELVLVALIIIGLVGRSSIITTAACILLVIKLTHLDRYLPTIERRGIELGLLFLTLAVLVPFASGRIQPKDMIDAFGGWVGWVALAGGAIGAYLNSKGLETLKMDPQLIVGIVVGSIAGVVLLRGIPVGPLMAAGITAMILKIVQLFIGK
ncbi:DUF441 domain-containing protein [Cohnella terricola]|uniref:UPF0756 membrane protein FPZ45_02350 n=1 Tax=Cohnella terricola TaxID=1289167 RepID=A0A559JXP6_9BACL|nr:DUF441 domain-containing protein [Cohnella terricola]TVY04656.1 DUF441 domain-containing protein [Cohnella terricola]